MIDYSKGTNKTNANIKKAEKAGKNLMGSRQVQVVKSNNSGTPKKKTK